MDRRTLYEQSKEPYRFSKHKLLFLSVRGSLFVCLLMIFVFGVILYVFQRDRWQTSIFLPAGIVCLTFVLSVVFPWIRSVCFLRQQERISQRKFDERKDMDKSENQREWLLCFFKPGILIFNRNAIDSLIGFTTSKVSMTHDGSTRIHLEYLDRNQKKQVVDFRHSKENQAKFEAWFYKR